jgi:hypothetical protein
MSRTAALTDPADIERTLGRQQRQFADRQRRLANADPGGMSALRRRAAKFYDVAALVHERAAAAIDRSSEKVATVPINGLRRRRSSARRCRGRH